MVRKSELRDIVLEEVSQLENLIRVDLAIPDSISVNDIASFFYAQLASDRPSDLHSTDCTVELEAEVRRETERFKSVCDQLQGTSALLLKHLSLAVGSISMLFDTDGSFSPDSHAEAISTIQFCAYIRGFARQNQPSQADELAALVRRAVGRSGGEKKNEPYKSAKVFVQDEWRAFRAEYRSKSEFARHYAPRVRNEFVDGKGDPLRVTEKTIREVWLSDNPPASKPAG